MRAHDIGLILKKTRAGEIGFEILVGGGLGRTPMIGKTVREFLPADELLAYCTAIMRVYNRFGRRDNKYKARVKILVHELGLAEFKREVETEYAAGDHAEGIALAAEELERIQRLLRPAVLRDACPTATRCTTSASSPCREFARWVRQNTARHKVPGYAIVNVSLKPIGGIPGDATVRADAHGGGTGRRVQPRRDPRHPRAEPGPAEREEAATCSRSGTCSRMPGSRRRTAT